MRQQFVTAKTREEAERECMWAMRIIKVDGGWQCFEAYHDADAWLEMTDHDPLAIRRL